MQIELGENFISLYGTYLQIRNTAHYSNKILKLTHTVRDETGKKYLATRFDKTVCAALNLKKFQRFLGFKNIVLKVDAT